MPGSSPPRNLLEPPSVVAGYQRGHGDVWVGMEPTLRFNPDQISASLARRWDIFDHLKTWPWLRRPCDVRILLYSDGAISFSGTGFSLTHVLATLAADPWYWVRFSVTKAHRGADPAADRQNVKLTDLDLTTFDEIWFYSFSSVPYGAAEVAAVDTFMANGGGVLVTGDHADLGGALGTIPRAGKMRLLPAPASAPPGWNTTLRDGPDPGATFDFNDQSDDVPQPLRLRRYPLGLFRSRPHPVMCGPDGPIDVLPDHQHEGEAIAPAVLAPAEWPTSSSGFQPRPEVIAWGRIIDPAAAKAGQEIGVVSAYDGHRADGLGRVVADSTWHHHLDVNLLGIPGSPTYQGFPASPGGLDALRKIEAYFLNIAVWLAPKAKQACMRNRACWGLVWREDLIELTPDAGFTVIGGHAINALGKIAPQCTFYGWLLELLPIKLRLAIENPKPDPGPRADEVLEHVVGAVFASLIEEFGRSEKRLRPPDGGPTDKAFEAIIAKAVPVGAAALAESCRAVAKEARSLAKLAGAASEA